MEKYVFLDIENPNCRNNSICSIGLVIVEENEILEKLYTLINPEDRFDNINSKITGIENSMVQGSPTLIDYWVKIKTLLEESIIVGHNIEYDLSVLSKALDRYNITPPKFKYICTYKLSKQYLELNSYKLEDLCNYIGYKYVAHNALEDALASFELFKFISKNNLINDYQLYDYINHEVESIDSRLESNINDLYGIVKGITYDEITKEEENKLKFTFEEILNPYTNQFSIELDGMTYCLTGEFKNGTKTDINNILKNYGAIEKSGVTSKTDYLFVGSLGSDAWKYGNIGGKIAKAQELKEKGAKIEIICEDELFNMINNDEFCTKV